MRVGVLLSGCGVGDGSQIEEVILTYLALDKYNVDYICIAPNKSQFHTVNHFSEIIDSACERNILIESARIGRGNIISLDNLNPEEIDGLIIPGGLGIFKNLSNYITEKQNFNVDSEIECLLKNVYTAKKPIGTMCGGIVLVARCLGDKENHLEVCTAQGAYKNLLEMNHVSVTEITSKEVVIDVKNKIVTTPAFLGTQNLHEMMLGIDKMVKALIEIN